jgi:hypothetical protein
MRFAAVVVAVMVACKPEWKPCVVSRLTPGVCTRTALDESAVEDPSMVLVRFAYVWQGKPATTMPFEWLPRSRLPAVRDRAHDRVTCDRVTSGPGCRVWLLPEKAARDAPAPPPLAAREAVCPRGGHSVSTTLVDASVLASALAPSVGEWQGTVDVAAVDAASAIYARGVQQVRVTVRDMIRACTGVAGSGEVLLETQGDAEAIRSRVLSATSAVLLRWPGPPVERAQVVMWIADRCQVVVESTAPHHVSPKVGVSVEDIIAVGRAVDVARLEAICSAR